MPNRAACPPQIGSLIKPWTAALRLGRAFLTPSVPGLVDRRVCRSEDLACFFQPLSPPRCQPAPHQLPQALCGCVASAARHGAAGEAQAECTRQATVAVGRWPPLSGRRKRPWVSLHCIPTDRQVRLNLPQQHRESAAMYYGAIPQVESAVKSAGSAWRKSAVKSALRSTWGWGRCGGGHADPPPPVVAVHPPPGCVDVSAQGSCGLGSRGG